MSERKIQQMVCIGCPMGCPLVVEPHGATAWSTSGYECKKGKKYGEQEAEDPRRMVTTTVAIEGALWSRLPVRTAKEVPKGLVVDVCRAVHQLRLQGPVKVGDVILADVLGTGSDIIATRSM